MSGAGQNGLTQRQIRLPSTGSVKSNIHMLNTQHRVVHLPLCEQTARCTALPAPVATFLAPLSEVSSMQYV